MKKIKTYLNNIVLSNRPLILAGLIALFSSSTSNLLFADWAWPWEAGYLRDQAEQAHYAQIDSDSRAALAKRDAALAASRARHIAQLSIAAGLFCAGVIIYLVKTRKTIQQVVKNGIVEKVVHEEVIVRSPAHELVSDMLVIDGLNVIYGAPSYQSPSLVNLIGLLLELQKRKCGFKCFFDANTYYAFKDANKLDEADTFEGLCRAFPDQFILVPGRTKADDFILDYAHNHGTPIISNDHFRGYEEKYGWLKSDPKRRVSFIVHSGMLQIVPLGMQAPVPTNLKAAASSLKLGFRKPVMTKAPVESSYTNNRANNNGKMTLATS